MSEHKQEVNQYENGNEVTTKRSKKRACARHCKKWWWVYLILALVGILVIVIVAIFGVVPRVAQDKMNAAHLEIQGVNVLETESNRYLIRINSTITTDGSIHANVDPFDGVMYLEDTEAKTPFTRLRMPQTNANKLQTVNISQPIDIDDMDAFREFNIAFHNNETLRVTIEGRTKVQPRGLARKYGVNFKKTITLNGLNNFAGTEVTNGHISLRQDSRGRNFNGTANIPNASHFTLDIGNASFVNFVGDELVGSLYIDNLLLVPGDNHVNITANMNQVKIIELVRQRPYCETGIVPFKLLGDNVTNHDQDLSYFAAALASKNQTVEMDIGSIIKNDLKATVNCADD